MAKKTTSKSGKELKDEPAEADTALSPSDPTTQESLEVSEPDIADAENPETPSEEELKTDASIDPASDDEFTQESSIEDVPQEQPAEDIEPVADDPTPEQELETETRQETPAPTSATSESNSGVMPMVLGGIAAGAIGFAAAYFGLAQQPDTRGAALSKQVQDLTTSLDEQTVGLAGLTDQVEALGAGPDLEPLTNQLNGITEAIANLSERVVESETALQELESRLGQVEQRPVTEGASQAAIDAYERELGAARNAIAEQRTEIESLIKNALSAEDAAEDAAKAAMQRAATSRILTALESGAAFPSALADLEATGVAVPAELSRVAETGVVPLLDLQETFPEAARSALSASRSASGAEGGVSGFLRTQLGARSLEPREGDDPDAVLSRVEAAIRDGRLTDALAEIEALPDEGQAELSDWVGQVTERMSALNAAQSLSETLN